MPVSKRVEVRIKNRGQINFKKVVPLVVFLVVTWEVESD